MFLLRNFPIYHTFQGVGVKTPPHPPIWVVTYLFFPMKKSDLPISRDISIRNHHLQCFVVDQYLQICTGFPVSHHLNDTPLKFNSSPLKIYHPHRKVVFQPSLFRCELLIFGGVSDDSFQQLLTQLQWGGFHGKNISTSPQKKVSFFGIPSVALTEVCKSWEKIKMFLGNCLGWHHLWKVMEGS